MGQSVLCAFSDVFGRPSTGVHSFKVFDIAVVDALAAIAAAAWVARRFQIRFLLALALVFLSGVVAHRMFCVRTTVDKLLFHPE